MKPEARLSRLEKMKTSYRQQAQYWEAIAKELRLKLDNTPKYEDQFEIAESIVNSHIHYYAKEKKHCKSLRQALTYQAKIDALEKLLEDLKEKR